MLQRQAGTRRRWLFEDCSANGGVVVAVTVNQTPPSSPISLPRGRFRPCRRQGTISCHPSVRIRRLIQVQQLWFGFSGSKAVSCLQHRYGRISVSSKGVKERVNTMFLIERIKRIACALVGFLLSRVKKRVLNVAERR